MLIAIGSLVFHDVSSSHSFPITVIFTVIRTRHCRLQRSCIEGSSVSVGFMAAFFFLLCSLSRVIGRYAKCETKVFETHVIICCSTTHGSCSC